MQGGRNNPFSTEASGDQTNSKNPEHGIYNSFSFPSQSYSTSLLKTGHEFLKSPEKAYFKSHHHNLATQQPRYTLYYEQGKAQFFDDRNALFAALVARQDGCFWIDITAPTREDLIACGQFVPGNGFHPLTIEDILEMDPREKCELFDHYLFLVISTIASRESTDNIDPSFVYIGLFEQGLISLHHRSISHHISRVLRRLDGSGFSAGISPLSSGPNAPSSGSTNSIGLTNAADWILYCLLDDFIDALIPISKALEFEVDSIDDLVLLLSQADKSDMIRRIGTARKAVTGLLRILMPKRELIKSISVKLDTSSSSSSTSFSFRGNPKTLLYLRDAQDHVLSMNQSLEHFMDTLNTAHSNYLAQISIELTDASNRMNEVVKRLTVFTVIFLPLTLIAGIMGMNVPLPFQPGVTLGELGPFFVILLLMMSLLAAFIYGMWRTRML